eukprot:3958985-Prymnesium_polylepis.3
MDYNSEGCGGEVRRPTTRTSTLIVSPLSVPLGRYFSTRLCLRSFSTLRGSTRLPRSVIAKLGGYTRYRIA